MWVRRWQPRISRISPSETSIVFGSKHGLLTTPPIKKSNLDLDIWEIWVFPISETRHNDIYRLIIMRSRYSLLDTSQMSLSFITAFHKWVLRFHSLRLRGNGINQEWNMAMCITAIISRRTISICIFLSFHRRSLKGWLVSKKSE